MAYDLYQFLKYFISTKKWFSWKYYNWQLTQFKFEDKDVGNKPCSARPGSNKLTGDASQIWCLLRLFSLILKDKIRDFSDPVWDLYLQLKKFVELVMSPKVSKLEIAFLVVLLKDYKEGLMKYFPGYNLKAKHHYVFEHYPELILHYGPLIRLWTLRFESKHHVYKKFAQNTKNFLNITKTLSHKHQIQQAYFMAGTPFPPTITYNVSSLIEGEISQELLKEIAACNLKRENVIFLKRGIYKGTLYRQGSFVVTKTCDDYLQFGCIQLMMIWKSGNEEVLCWVTLYKSKHCVKLHVYELSETNLLLLINVNDLADFYPLPSYNILGKKIISLKHSVHHS